jgi:gamma-glutamyl-gamma-aminobutyrate hydrolase PuuD
VLGVQWHPERLEGEHKAIFAAFKEAIHAAGAERS